MADRPATPAPSRAAPPARRPRGATTATDADREAHARSDHDRSGRDDPATAGPAGRLGPRAVLRLQRAGGNRAVAGLLGRTTEPSGPVVQRVGLGILVDPGDEGSQLDTDRLDGIRDYVDAAALRGRRDLLRILLDRVRRRAPAALGAVQGYVDAAAFVEAPTTAVPDVVHVIWMGDRIRKEAVDNIVSLHGKAARLTLWTDSRKSGFLASTQAAPLVRLADGSATFAIRHVDEVVDPRLTNTYALALQRNAYSMASDLARYSILFSQGGVYMDVDLSFGAVTTLSDLELPAHGLPLLGPNIRDAGAREQVLASDLEFLRVRGDIDQAQVPASLGGDVTAVVDRAFRTLVGLQGPAPAHEAMTPDTLATTLSDKARLGAVDKTRVAARTEYLMGKYANQFIAAPAGHGFLDFVIADISGRLESTDAWNPEQVAALTGPSFFSTAIEGYYRTQGVRGLDPPERRHVVEPAALARVVDLGWLTAESENQLGKEVAPATTGPSGTAVVAVVAAAVAIGAIAAAWFALRGRGTGGS